MEFWIFLQLMNVLKQNNLKKKKTPAETTTFFSTVREKWESNINMLSTLQSRKKMYTLSAGLAMKIFLCISREFSLSQSISDTPKTPKWISLHSSGKTSSMGAQDKSCRGTDWGAEGMCVLKTGVEGAWVLSMGKKKKQSYPCQDSFGVPGMGMLLGHLLHRSWSWFQCPS